ncbi:lysine--tRNA ligase [Myxococcota bacterium]|nr:lysine--tRNA ligase [Myxococcota bacterium]MBU1536748.1 lysine--tRNA ligase [Myxococcota bacterium]
MSNYKSWPFTEAASLLKSHGPFDGAVPVRFETGFGPSGLPHIGTFAEVARTTWVRKAFENLTGLPTELIAFSDDMDGLRKVPENLPNKEMLTANLGKPLSVIPDPFGEAESFSAYMNGKLQEFLNTFGFEYRFQSSSEAYKRGDFDLGLKTILEKHDDIRSLIIPTLREENRADWSPVMPICPKCGKVYSTRVIKVHPGTGTLDMACDRSFGAVEGCGFTGEIPVTGGNAKVGWKVDWALRWFSYGISYEMYGKDLIESARLSAKICRLLGKKSPAGLFYEMFLDENGEKISKSVGKGLTVDSWLTYAPIESLLYYIFQNPKKAKRLFFDMIPKVVDDYLGDLKTFGETAPEARPDLASWHLFGGNPPAYESSISFSVVSNLVSAVGADDPELLYKYLDKYDEKGRDYMDTVRSLVEKSLVYYRDFILPDKSYIVAQGELRTMLQELLSRLEAFDASSPVDGLQSIPFDIAKEHEMKPQEFFTGIYQCLLGQERGPRFGSFVKLIGVEKLKEMLAAALNREAQ